MNKFIRGRVCHTHEAPVAESKVFGERVEAEGSRSLASSCPNPPRDSIVEDEAFSGEIACALTGYSTEVLLGSGKGCPVVVERRGRRDERRESSRWWLEEPIERASAVVSSGQTRVSEAFSTLSGDLVERRGLLMR
jgi:hypothetical protein